MNLCARMQLEFARLRLYRLQLGSRRPTEDEARASARAIAALLTRISSEKARRAGEHDAVWIHARLWDELTGELEAQADLLEGSGIEFVRATLKEIRSFVAAERMSQPTRARNEDADLDLALREISAVFGDRTNDLESDHPAFHTLARRLARDPTAVKGILEDFGRWARDREGRSLHGLLADVGATAAARAIWEDYEERLAGLLYVPFVPRLGGAPAASGVAIPLRVETAFGAPLAGTTGLVRVACRLLEPRAGRSEPGSICDEMVDSSFTAGVQQAAERARRELIGRNLPVGDLTLTLYLPDLRLLDAAVPAAIQPWIRYEEGSVQLPVALVVCTQEPYLRAGGVRPNPRVVASGPVARPQIKAKLEAARVVGGFSTLLVTPRYADREMAWTSEIQGVGAPGQKEIPLRDALEAFVSRDCVDLLRRDFSDRVIAFPHATELPKWHLPLEEAHLMKTAAKRQMDPILEGLFRHRLVAAEGVSGIGKSTSVASWLEGQSRFGVVVYTSWPLQARTAERVWAQAFGMLTRDLQQRLQGLPPPPAEGGPGDLVEWLAQVGTRHGGLLWVVDDGDWLLDEDGGFPDSRLSETVRSAIVGIQNGHHRGLSVLFLSTRPPLPDMLRASYRHAVRGFSIGEAGSFLQARGMLRRTRAIVLDMPGISSHPLALRLLSGDLKQRATELASPHLRLELIQDLLTEVGKHRGTPLAATRDGFEGLMGGIVGHAVGSLGGEGRSLLLLASTFPAGFDARSLARLQKRLWGHLPKDSPYLATYRPTLDRIVRVLSSARGMGLLAEKDGCFHLQTLVRDYLQAHFEVLDREAWMGAHEAAADLLLDTLRLGSLSSTEVRPQDLAFALFHLEKADATGKIENLLVSLYAGPIAKAREWTERGFRVGAKGVIDLLRGVIAAHETVGTNARYPGAIETSYDLNVLFADALLRSNDVTLFEEAAFHYREARTKSGAPGGSRDRATQGLVYALCRVANSRLETEDSAGAQEAWREARTLFEELPSETRRFGSMIEWVARMHDRMGQRADALRVLRQALDAGVRWDALYTLAATLVAETDERLLLLRQGRKVCPRSKALYLAEQKLTCSTDRGAIPEAATFSPFPTILLAQWLEENGRLTDARKLLERGLDVHPVNVDLRCQLGQMLERDAENDEALRLYLRGARLTGSANLYERLGALQEKLGKLEKAEVAYREGWRIAPGDYRFPLSLGRVCRALGREAEAEASLREGIKMASEKAPLYLRLAELLEGRGRPAEALKAIEAGVTACRQDTRIRGAYAVLLSKAGRSEDAMSFLRRSLREVSDSGPLYVMLGGFAEAQGNLPEAEAIYREGWRLAPSDFRFPISLGSVYTAQGREAEAEASLREGIKAARDKSVLYLKLAAFLEERGDQTDALKVLEAGLATSPKDARIRVAYAGLLSRAGRSEEAMSFLRRSLDEVSTPGPLYVMMSKLEQRRGNLEEAARALEKALEQEPTNYSLYKEAADLLSREGTLDRAREILDRGIRAVRRPGRLGVRRVRLAEGEEELKRVEVLLAEECRNHQDDPMLFVAQAIGQLRREGSHDALQSLARARAMPVASLSRALDDVELLVRQGRTGDAVTLLYEAAEAEERAADGVSREGHQVHPGAADGIEEG